MRKFWSVGATWLVLSVLCSGAESAESNSGADTQWPSYNLTADGQRFAAADQINVKNAAQLGEVCRIKVADAGTFQSGLVQIGGLIYLTTALDTFAIDATNCSVRWRHSYTPEQEVVWSVNRGVAYSNGKIFRGTPDARLLAIDALSGKTVWQHQVGDPQLGEFFSAAPQVFQGLLIIGAAGGDWGTRGRVMAFDAETGREVWRFNTIPRGKETGAETWKNVGTARYGGGGTWTSYTLDMASGEVFVPVGNPAPDFIPAHRPGLNLFANSMVVLDARTGALKWYYQLVSNDGHDLDLGAAPMLYFNSKGDGMVGLGSKDGYVYGIDRETHKKVFRTPITTIKNEGVLPTPAGVLVCPGPLGGVEWNGPALDKVNKTIVAGTVDWCAVLKREENFAYKPGTFNLGGHWEFQGKGRGAVVALDVDTGEVRWSYKTPAPQVAGVTPTAGGVIFSGDMAGNFFALEGATGKELFKVQTGGALAGGVITYLRGGKQYVAFASGNVSRLFNESGSSGSPSLVIYALKSADVATTTQTPVGTSMASGTVVASGAGTYASICSGCHGAKGEGGVGPTLRGISKRLDLNKTVEWIKSPSEKMPKLYPSPLDEQSVVDVARYIQGL
ncbi:MULTISPECIES: PQQ-binding-like beta-propeller repeat protein [unclassified Methylibium]|uniref:outer membrane protein assembly factor BamB family protein n=1 Tax=unclassified Methylibium TaxID=2633235 RepID=UPI0003F3F555|nr:MULTISPECIES: PQQ-binding-like beta-propeller repeat protein [unclassified Methylibium]EWS53871.1 Quinohemoprotein ethanol dehydrogenase type-1 precursor [Methylibium sp. T29]EWS61761.1 Quinohemoprotein ethanol dehydrogenase type-1 precursor [Methylibium sp. T29-B]